MEEMFFDHELCRKCKGRCCQLIGCALSPKDFKEQITEKVLIERLKKDIIFSKVVVEFKTPIHLKSDSEGYILLLPRIKGVKDKNSYIRKKNKGYNPCMYWSRDKGCIFSDKKRPFGGVSLIPMPDFIDCYNTYEGSLEHFKDWIPYQKIILNSLKYLKEELKMKKNM